MILWMFFCVLLPLVHGQDVIFTQYMQNVTINEDAVKGTYLSQLRAIYLGSSDGIKYGIATDDEDTDSSDIKFSNDNFEVYENGSVFLVNVGIDKEDELADVDIKCVFVAILIANPNKFARIQSTIQVNDVNDFVPLYIPSPNSLLKYPVPENLPPGSTIIQNITFIDKDIPTPLQYMDVHCNDSEAGTDFEGVCDIFEAYPLNFSTRFWVGDLRLKGSLDFETKKSWTIVFRAWDGRNEAFKDFTVAVLDTSDTPPVFKSLEATYIVDEQEDEVLISTVEAVDGDKTILRRVVYKFLEVAEESNPADYREIFRIDENTGDIFRRVVLDLESPPFGHDVVGSLWLLRVQACEVLNDTSNPIIIGTTDSLDCSSEDTRIQINDINDNAPEFDQDTYYLTLHESERDGFPHSSAITVIDKDGEQFNKFDLLIPDPTITPIFELRGSVKRFNLVLKNTSLIDYESDTKQYRFQLLAVDRNDSSLNNTATVIIDIIDDNDNQPVFTQTGKYVGSVPETAPAFTTILNVQATDVDSGLFGTDGLVYSLQMDPLFDIHPTTGAIFVAECETGTYGESPCLNYDLPPRSYRGQVTVQDNRGIQPGAQLYVSREVEIFLEPVNEHRPKTTNLTANIFEGETNTVYPLVVQGRDDDKDQLTYSILVQSPGNFWTIDSLTGTITATVPIFLNMGKEFVLIVDVSDGQFSSYAHVTITVLDINNNAPEFLLSNYTREIPETFPSDQFLLNVTAVDNDDPTTQNGQVEYTLVSGHLGKFVIDRNTGEVKTAKDATFDFDDINKYTIAVQAEDLGVPRRTGEAIITVHILDANNKNPYFDPFSQEAVIFNTHPFNTLVKRVVADDPDSAHELRYYFDYPTNVISLNGDVIRPDIIDAMEYFKIDEVSGDVILITDKLRDSLINFISYTMVVVDINVDPVQTGVGTFTIHILQYNFRGPQFVDVPEFVLIDEEKMDDFRFVTAIDPDGLGISYEIVTQPDNYFAISPETGIVSVVNRIDFDDERKTNESYFVVRALDSGEPQLDATVTVTVKINNINDNTPEFKSESASYIAEIPENSPSGYPVGIQIQATDADRSDDNKGYADIFYVLEDPRFSVNYSTGEIFVDLKGPVSLDREVRSFYRLLVQACDAPNEPSVRRCRTTVASVRLVDVNDNGPIFTRDNYFQRILETIGMNTEILTVYITDKDQGVNAQSHFRKIQGRGDPNDFFGVTTMTGRVYTKKDLLGYTGTYTFEVEAQDRLGTGNFTDNALVTIEVIPSANFPPMWVIPPYDNQTIYVLEEQYKGMLVYKVKAIDTDSNENGIVDYMFSYEGIRTNGTPEFHINSLTGQIHAEIVFDREKVDRYVLLLVASDRGETRLEAARFLTIVVKDVNDHRPSFDRPQVEFNIPENTEENYRIGDVKATDLDLDPVIYYRIIAGNEDNVFRIDMRTGDLFVAKRIDRERKSVYFLDVQAYNDEPDYTVQSRRRRDVDSSIITVKIVIGDVNDLAPVFLSDNYYGCVSTRSSFNKHIVTIQAIDRDAVGTGIVRYRLTGGFSDSGQDLFAIHPKFGVITNQILMEEYVDRTFILDVEARDAELLEDAETVTTQAKVFVTRPSNEARMTIRQNTGEVRLYQTQIQKLIEETSEVDYLCINRIQDHVIDTSGSTTALWSDVFVTAIKQSDSGEYVIKSGIETRNIISREMISAERKKDYDLLYIDEVVAVSDEQTYIEQDSLLVVMIIIAVLIFLLIVFCIIAFICIRMAKKQKKRLVVQKAYKSQSGPAPEPVVFQQEVVAGPVYDNRAFVPVQEDFVVESGMYAQVQKVRPPSDPEPVPVQEPEPEPVREPSPEPAQISLEVEDEPRYEVQIENDSPPPTRRTVEEEYTIETQVM